MSASRGLIVHVGDARGDTPEALSVGWHDDADVPFRPGDELPFGDATVDVMTLADFVEDLAFETQVHLLMECRRVLAPGGLIAVVPAPEAGPVIVSEASEASVAGIAALVGLEPASEREVPSQSAAVDAKRRDTPRRSGMTFTKPDRRVLGDPLVSIAIPAYNPRFFEASLDSAIGQTYDNIEIVVCDDDLLAPACVERLLDTFRRAPDITLATSHRLRIDAAGMRLGEQPATQAIVAGDSVIAGYTLANAVLMAGLNRVGEPSTAMFRKSDFAAPAPDYFRFRGTAGHGIIDMVMWTALLMKGNAVYLADSLSAFRIHPEQRQHDPSTRQRNIDSIRSLQAEWLALMLFDRVRPHLLLAKPFPPGESDWAPQPVLGVAARPIAEGVVGTTG